MKFLIFESILNVLFFGSAFIFSLFQVIHHQISLGQFVMIASYVIMLSGPLEIIGSMFTALMKSTGSLHFFLNGINHKRIHNEVISDFGYATPNILFSDVTFSYKPDSLPIIKNLNIHISGSLFITITGASGAGKSTVARLIAREISPSNGHIYLNGKDINKLTLQEMADSIYYVSQNDWIFMDSLRFNLLIACPTATESQLIAALEFAKLNELHHDKEGNILDILIGDNGMTLSGGQRQRLSLARLFLRNPNIIILDEVTSSLDVINENTILENIKLRFQNSLIINISHRPTTFQHSDEITVLNPEGKIEKGKLSELANNNSYLHSIVDNTTKGKMAEPQS